MIRNIVIPVVVLLTFVAPMVVVADNAEAKGKNPGTDNHYLFEGAVWDDVTITRLPGITIKITYDWPIGGPHAEYIATGSLGEFIYTPAHVGTGTIYTMWVNYPNQDLASVPSHWIERRQVTFPAAHQVFWLPHNSIGYLYTTETYANSANVEIIKYTKTTTHSYKVSVGGGVSGFGSGYDMGYETTLTRTVTEGFSSPTGKSLQVRIPYMSTGVYSLYPGTYDQRVIEQAWLYGTQAGPLEVGDFKADTMKRPNKIQNQAKLDPEYPWELTFSFSKYHTHQYGVEIGVGIAKMVKVGVQVDYEKTSGTSDEMYFKIVNHDTVAHTYEYYWDGFDLHLWLVR